ncbi:MAG: hypothetical protein B6240_08215 [Desulfobacteraceae bacterium 4572_87]|nr:MAG: hypothetical protein B6240_08215 [Desulfobacteraceae bacterium 4572_87]
MQALVLSEKAEEKINGAIGHIHNIPHTFAKFIVSPPKFDFIWQIFRYGLLNAVTKKLSMGSRIEVSVKTSGRKAAARAKTSPGCWAQPGMAGRRLSRKTVMGTQIRTRNPWIHEK